MRLSAIILLAGRGERFATALPKQFQKLGTKQVYQHALDTFQTSGLFAEIVLVTPEGFPLPGSVTGGATRQSSSYQGLLALHKDTDYVVIHDGARPFVTQEILLRNVEAVQKYRAVSTCIPSPDAINLIEGDRTLSVLGRQKCLRGQTPQSFAYPLIMEAHQKKKEKNAPCDCSLVLELGHPVHVVEGAEKNFKITSQSDLALAHFFLAQEAHPRLY